MGARAYFEVQCTNDYEKVETFHYDRKEIAIEVAKALTINYTDVYVHAVFSYIGSWDEEAEEYPLKTLKKTIYEERCESEDVVITADGAIPADEVQKSGEEE